MDPLLSLVPSLDQLSRIIGSVAAPAFLLGAVASYISLLISRIERVLDRSRYLDQISESDEKRSYLKADLPRLKRRAELLNEALLYAALSGVFTALITIVAFITAILHVSHEYGVAALFVVALAFFLLSIILLVRETRIGLHDFDYHA